MISLEYLEYLLTTHCSAKKNRSNEVVAVTNIKNAFAKYYSVQQPDWTAKSEGVSHN